MIKYLFDTDDFLEEHKDCKSVLEVCSGPGFIGWFLYKKLKMDSVHFWIYTNQLKKIYE